MMDVTLSRETATFSVPVSEAVWPQSLSAALAQGQPENTAQNFAALADHAGNINVEERLIDGTALSGQQEIELSDHDIAFIGRLKPQAAE